MISWVSVMNCVKNLWCSNFQMCLFLTYQLVPQCFMSISESNLSRRCFGLLHFVPAVTALESIVLNKSVAFGAWPQIVVCVVFTAARRPL